MTRNVFFFLTFKKDVSYLYDTMPIKRALPLLRSEGFSAVPVISSEGQYCGSISEGDFLWSLYDRTGDDICVRDLIRPDFMPAVNVNVPFETLVARALNQNYVPIVDDRSIFIGIVTRSSLLREFLKETDGMYLCSSVFRPALQSMKAQDLL